MKKIILLVLGVMLVLSGCTSLAKPTAYLPAGPSPHTQYASFPKEEALLACYANSQWGPEARQTNIAITQILDQSNKATYGDEGTGPMMPTNSASSASAAVNMLMSEKSHIMPINREKWLMDTMQQEAVGELRDRPKALKANYYLNGTISGVDALAASVQQYVLYGVGGGPSQQRWEIVMDLQLTDGTTTGIPYTTSVKHQFVQTEIKLFAAKIMFGGKMKSLASADVEEAVRSEMQTMIKPMVYSAVADLAGKLPGSPATCGTKVQKFLSSGV